MGKEQGDGKGESWWETEKKLLWKRKKGDGQKEIAYDKKERKKVTQKKTGAG